MARQLTVDFGRQGIRANVLCPGWIATDAQNQHAPRPDTTAYGPVADARADVIHPVGRAGLPADIASAAVFLASDEASFVAGAVLVVDGGLTVQTPGSLLPLVENYYRSTLANPATSPKLEIG